MSVKDRLPPPNWLRAFEAAARHLSFTHAANELNVTQSAISQQVRLLESYLHEQLFQRHRRGLELTDAGCAYLEVIRVSFDNIRRGTNDIFGSNSPMRITLKCNVSFSTLWLPAHFGDFVNRHPDIDVRITNAVWWDHSDQAGVDLEIRYGNGDWPGVSAIKLTRETLTPLADSAYIRQHGINTPPDLLECTLLHSLGHQYGWQNWFEMAGVAPRDKLAGMRFDTASVVLEMTRYGLGVSLGMTSLRQGMVDRGELVQVFDIELPLEEGFYLVAQAQSLEKPYVDDFVNWLTATASPHIS